MYAGEISDIAVSELPSQRIYASEMDDIIVSHLGGIDKTDMISDVKSNSKYLKNSEDIELDFEKANKNSYANGIHLLRLVNNKIGEPEELKFDDLEEDDELESENKQQSLFLQRDSQEEDYDEFDIDSTFKSRKTLNQIINNQKIPPVIRNLKYGANVLMLILFAIAFSEYFVTLSHFNVI